MHGRFPYGLKQNTSADAARITTTPKQLVILVTLFAGMTASLVIWPSATLPMAFRAFQIGFLILIGWRILALLISQRPQLSPPGEPALLPKYSIVVALYDEAAVLPQLVQRLRAIDYPADLLDGYLVLKRMTTRPSTPPTPCVARTGSTFWWSLPASLRPSRAR